MGLAAYRMIGSAVTALVGRPPADAHAGPAGLAAAGQRLFVDITPGPPTPPGATHRRRRSPG